MLPPRLWIPIASSILLGLAPVPSAADAPADPAALADLAARERQLRAEVDELLRAWTVAATEEASPDLMALLTPRDRAAPPAQRAWTRDGTIQVRGAADTVCTQQGATLTCVPRDLTPR